MNLRSVLIIFSVVSMSLILNTESVQCQSGSALNVCQELVSSARSYEARATYHSQIAKSLQMQIENVSKLPKNQSTVLTMDQLFAQYDENRALESKFRDMSRKATDDAKGCMK
jgi:hypothetical protein